MSSMNMYKKILQKSFNNGADKTFAWVQVLVLVVATLIPLNTQAAQLESRQLELSSAAAGATGVEYTFNFDVIGAADEVTFEFCDNDPFPGETCSAPTGFDVSSATATGDFGTATSYTGDNEVEVSGSSVTAASSAEVVLDGVTNPDGDNTEFFVRIYTANSGSAVDEGGLAFSTGNTIDVTARVQETLSFCVYTDDCGSGGNVVDLGVLNTASTETAESYFDVATNARNGMTVQYLGDTLTSDTFEIDAFNGGDGALAASSTGSEQFGLRVSDVDDGGQNAIASAPFAGGGASQYAFHENNYDDIGESSGPVESTTFTVEWAANVAPLTETGVYSTQVEFIATATF